MYSNLSNIHFCIVDDQYFDSYYAMLLWMAYLSGHDGYACIFIYKTNFYRKGFENSLVKKCVIPSTIKKENRDECPIKI